MDEPEAEAASVIQRFFGCGRENIDVPPGDFGAVIGYPDFDLIISRIYLDTDLGRLRLGMADRVLDEFRD